MQDMKKIVDSERSARTDLEMYVAVLNTQKGVLQEDTDKLKRELHNGIYFYNYSTTSVELEHLRTRNKYYKY